MGKPEGRPGRSRHRYDNNIEIDLQFLRWEGLGVGMSGTGCCEEGNEHSVSRKCGEFLG
jgi:hypothetical protein